MELLRKAAGIESWPHNGLRHSFGSYHLAFHGDAIKTAQQMGHRSADVVHNHYKALVLKTEAEKFWKLFPTVQTC
jgi:integrase